MKKWSSLEVRDTAELRVVKGNQISVFTVEVLDIDDNAIYITRPVIDPDMLDVSKGKSVEIEYQSDDYVYRFKTKIIGEKRIRSFAAIIVESPTQLSRVKQPLKRMDIRVSIATQILYRAKGKSLGKGYKKGNINNVSAGGVSFHIMRQDSTEISDRTELLLSFTLSDKINVIELEGVVIKVSRSHRYLGEIDIICRFTNIPYKTREAITVHNIHYQRRLIREGRLGS